MMRISDELLYLLGDEYDKLVKAQEIDTEVLPFHIFLERDSIIYSKYCRRIVESLS